jgi:uncharacterized protein
MEKHITCVYHKDCIDGTAAAAVVLKKYPQAQTFPLAHNYSPDEIDTVLDLTDPSAHIYIVDSTLGLSEFLERGHTVTVIDHHISEHARVLQIAGETTSLTYIFDNTKSGASLSWAYLFPEEVAPALIPHVEDNDLWKKQLGETTEHIVNYLSLWNNDPHKVVELFETPLVEIVSQGTMLTTYAHNMVGRLILLEPITLRIENHEVLAYNITNHQSACGNVLAEENGAAVALYTIIGNEVKFSFRSTKEQEPSALKLAMSLGGGGHRNASGATIPLTDFIERIIKTS